MTVFELVRPDSVGPALVEATGDERWLTFHVQLIAGGKSNLTFELTSAAGSLIFRRPPTGTLLPSAHNMAREARVQRALASTSVPVPEIVLLDAEGELLGVPFYVMKKADGHVIRGELPHGYAMSIGDKRALAITLAETLATLHRVEPDHVGLADFGRPEGFVVRQLRRWGEQWERTKTVDIDVLEELASRLAKQVPTPSKVSILHGDYRIDNCVFSMDGPSSIEAILDWEMSSLGDPLVDLGMMRYYWRSPEERAVELVPSVTRDPAFPTRDFLAEQYAVFADVDLDDLSFYDAFARFKFAIITQGVLVRSKNGNMAGQVFGNLEDEVRAIATEGLDILR